MSLTIANLGDGTGRFRLDRIANLTKLSLTAERAAHYFWGPTDPDWATATNTQKLAKLEQALVSTVRAAADSYNVSTAAETARLSAITANQTEHDLG